MVAPPQSVRLGPACYVFSPTRMNICAMANVARCYFERGRGFAHRGGLLNDESFHNWGELVFRREGASCRWHDENTPARARAVY
jgi:hypothetical protein